MKFATMRMREMVYFPIHSAVRVALSRQIGCKYYIAHPPKKNSFFLCC